MDGQAAGQQPVSGDGGSPDHHASLTPNSAAHYNGPRVFWVK